LPRNLGENIKQLKINQQIHHNRFLLIDDENKSLGEVSFDQAMYLAYEKGLDLVMINENATPPVCKLLDYGKYLYNQEKQLAKQKAHAHTQELKEIRLSVKIDEHDLQVKINRIKEFLTRGDKVKIALQLKGREMLFANRVNDLLERVRKESNATFEKPVERMGNKFFVTFVKSKVDKEESNENK
jgi:translation initiation factor IF-3